MRQAITADPSLHSLKVSGGAHPIVATREIVSTAAQVAQYGAMAFFVLGDRYLFPALRVPVPPWYDNVARNRVPCTMGAFFIGNMVATNLQKTGAFEVHYDGKLIWSKLNSGQNPDPRGIIAGLRRAIPAQ